MKKTIILCAVTVLSTVGGSLTYAQEVPAATTPDQKEAVGIMLRLGELYHQKAQLEDPKAAAKELLAGEASIMYDKNFSQRLADNARKLADQFDGDLRDKFVKDAEAIEADADAEAKQKRKELYARVGAKIKSGTEMEGEIKALESRFWATQYGQNADVSWTAQAKKDKEMYATYCASGRDGLLRDKAAFRYFVSQLVKTAKK